MDKAVKEQRPHREARRRLTEDPFSILASLGKGKLKGKSITQLKREARKEIIKHALLQACYLFR